VKQNTSKLQVQALLAGIPLLYGNELRNTFHYSKMHLDRSFIFTCIHLVFKMESTLLIWYLRVLTRLDFIHRLDIGAIWKLETSTDAALEIPVILGMENGILSLIQWANNLGIKWINLNELECAERNADQFNSRNYAVKDDISAAVKGSQELAYHILDNIIQKDLEMGVHYCSSSFKDGVQLTNRIKRRAKSVAQDHEVITDEGTLLKGVIYTKTPLQGLYDLLKQEFDIDDNYIVLNVSKKRIELALWILEKIAPKLKKRGFDCYMVEEVKKTWI